ncbi:MAG: vitamin B12 dependent-methionine synthase activation domain-containing protein, partial [Pseudanabaenaceae cyanobacterium bins.68]|nr:vitamin B12 dependent-methionine synthase activation domain-containing protein [Pseudanabaenaceae cyanobacterium bins.68]
VKAGMDSAIVHASKILPLNRIDARALEVAYQLIYDQRQFEGDICTYDPLGEFTKLFEGVSSQKTKVEDLDLPIEERLKQHIIDGDRQGLETNLELARASYPPLEIINNFLLEGMKVVGELFGSGQMQLPFVLQSAETMKAAVAYLEQFMEKVEGSQKGTVVIATVKGDVHDIGKNLVDIILSNNGYKVVNIGIKQSVENIIEAYEQHQADCIAMSGLLVKSTAFMQENLAEFNRRGIQVPVILGGAALTPKFVHEDCQNTYQGKVIYGRDAFSDLNFMDAYMPAKQAGNWDHHQGFVGDRAELNHKFGAAIAPEVEPKPEPVAIEVVVDTRRSEAIAMDIDRPQAPFWGTEILTPDQIPYPELFDYLDLQALIAGQWQFRKPKEQSRSEYDAFLAAKVYPMLEEWKAKIIDENLLAPTLVYGYFPVQAEGNELLIYDSVAASQVIAKFNFPRQRSLNRYCIADFFADRSSDQVDLLPMQAVTVGEIATEYAQSLFKDNRYSDYLYFHGMAVQMAEAMAEWCHARIRAQLGYSAQEPDNIRDILAQRYQGARYSFGYPACPNIQDQYILLDLLGAKRINLYMDESEQLYPEQSTTALVTYHPAAKYFSA